MDPNATLRQALDSLLHARSAYGFGNQCLLAAAHDSTCDAAANLSAWLAGGGFEPDWRAIVFDVLSEGLPTHPDDA